MKKIRVALLIDEFFGGDGTRLGGYGFLARRGICMYVPDKEIQIGIKFKKKTQKKEKQKHIVFLCHIVSIQVDKHKVWTYSNQTNNVSLPPNPKLGRSYEVKHEEKWFSV